MPAHPRQTPVRRDPDHDSHPVQPSDVYDPSELPARVDLRPHMPPVFDQRQLESCTGNALAGAYGYLEGRVAKKVINVSRLFIYYNERDVEGDTDKDGGACLHDGVAVLKKYGACSEDTWPYDEKKVKVKPHSKAYDEGKGHEIDQAATVAVDLHAMKHCLAEGYPFVFIIEIDGSSFKPDAKGFIEKPTGKNLSGHAMCAVGYDDAKKVFIVRNSWGAGWGDKGHCYLSYDWMTDKKSVFDPWTLRRGHGLDFSQVGLETEDDASDTSDTDEEDDDTDDTEDEEDESDDDAEDDSNDDEDKDDDSDDDDASDDDDSDDDDDDDDDDDSSDESDDDDSDKAPAKKGK